MQQTPYLGFSPENALAVIGSRPPLFDTDKAISPFNAHTCRGLLAEQVNLHKGVSVAFVDVGNPDAYTPNGYIKEYYLLDDASPGIKKFRPQQGWGIQASATKLGNFLPQPGDPPAFPDKQVFNSRAIREHLTTRSGMLKVLDSLDIEPGHRIPTFSPHELDQQPLDLPYFVKPAQVNDIFHAHPDYRAQLAPNRDEAERLAASLGHSAIIQPKLPTLSPYELISRMGVEGRLKRTVADSAVHTVRMYDLLWDSNARAVELRLSNRSDIGHRNATQSVVVRPADIDQPGALPQLVELHRCVREGVRTFFDKIDTTGRLGSVAMNYIIQSDGTPAVVNIDPQPSMPSIFLPRTSESDSRATEQQNIAKELCMWEGWALASLALKNGPPVIVKDE